MAQQEEDRVQKQDQTYRKPELTDLGALPQLTEGGSGLVTEPLGAGGTI